MTTGPNSQTSQRERKMRPEGDPAGPGKLTPDERRGQGEREPGCGSDQYDARQRLPTEPGAGCRQQLGVAEPQAFPAASPTVDACDGSER